MILYPFILIKTHKKECYTNYVLEKWDVKELEKLGSCPYSQKEIMKGKSDQGFSKPITFNLKATKSAADHVLTNDEEMISS